MAAKAYPDRPKRPEREGGAGERMGRFSLPPGLDFHSGTQHNSSYTRNEGKETIQKTRQEPNCPSNRENQEKSQAKRDKRTEAKEDGRNSRRTRTQRPPRDAAQTGRESHTYSARPNTNLSLTLSTSSSPRNSQLKGGQRGERSTSSFMPESATYERHE